MGLEPVTSISFLAIRQLGQLATCDVDQQLCSPRRGGERSRAGQRAPCAGESECTHLASRSQARAADSGQRGAGGDRGGHGRRSAAGGRRGRGGVSDFLFVAQGRSGGRGMEDLLRLWLAWSSRPTYCRGDKVQANAARSWDLLRNPAIEAGACNSSRNACASTSATRFSIACYKYLSISLKIASKYSSFKFWCGTWIWSVAFGHAPSPPLFLS